ncbi:MAG TPA: TSUP family transporter, partial [Euzebyales bacterium]|nr:TSUP family transporter [Euzebyales bacterium]
MTGLVASPLGLLIGLVLGALGGGGSVLAVPVLVYVVGQTPQEATGTSLVIVAVTALGGMVAHGRSGRLHLAVGAGFAAAVVAGSVAGSQVNAALPPRLLLGGFALLMLAAAAGMLRHGGDADAPFGIGDALVRGGAPVRERRAPRDGD